MSKLVDAMVLKCPRYLFSSDIFLQRQLVCGLSTFIAEKDERKGYRLFKRALESSP